MILFVGQIGTGMRDREAFQEVDYRAVFGTLAKWAVEIDHPDRVPELVARAFAVAQTGRPGPVVVALPEDMLSAATAAVAGPPVRVPKAAPAPEDLAEIARLLDGRRGAAGAGGRRRLGRRRPGRPARLRRGEPPAGDRRLPQPGPPRQRQPELRRRRRPRQDPRRARAPARGRRAPRRRPPLRRDPDRRLHALRHPAHGRDADPRPCLGRRAEPDPHRRPAGARPSRPADAGAGRAPPRGRRALGGAHREPRTPTGGRASPRRRSRARSTWARWCATCRRGSPPTPS